MYITSAGPTFLILTGELGDEHVRLHHVGQRTTREFNDQFGVGRAHAAVHLEYALEVWHSSANGWACGRQDAYGEVLDYWTAKSQGSADPDAEYRHELSMLQSRWQREHEEFQEAYRNMVAV